MLLDLLFPRTCVECGKRGVYFCKSCLLKFPLALQVCPMCGQGSIGGVTHARCRRAYGMDGLVGIFAYKDGIQQAVKSMKYRFVRKMGQALVEASWARIDPAVFKYFKREGFFIVPVPLHLKRERWRGFNQAALLGKLLAERLELEFLEVLRRIKDTLALAELRVRVSRSEREQLEERYVSLTRRRMVEQKLLAEKKSQIRAQEMRGAFQVKNSELKIQNEKFLLVDDVWTSGSTMLECAKVLKRSGASKVWGFVFARGGR